MKGLRKINSGTSVVDSTSWIQENEYALTHQKEIRATTKIILKLMDYMENSGLSQSDLARKLDVSPQYIHKLFHGQEKSFRIETAIEYGEKLGISLINIPEDDLMIYQETSISAHFCFSGEKTDDHPVKTNCTPRNRVSFKKNQRWTPQMKFNFA